MMIDFIAYYVIMGLAFAVWIARDDEIYSQLSGEAEHTAMALVVGALWPLILTFAVVYMLLTGFYRLARIGK